MRYALPFSMLVIFSVFSSAGEATPCARRDFKFDVSVSGEDLVITRDGKSCVLSEDKDFRNEEPRYLQVIGVHDDIANIGHLDLPELVPTPGYVLYVEKPSTSVPSPCTTALGRNGETFKHVYVKGLMSESGALLTTDHLITSLIPAGKPYGILTLNRCE